MSNFKTRERRRRREIAIRKARGTDPDSRRSKYWLALVKRDTRCASCGGHLREGSEFVYRSYGPVSLCVRCATDDPLVTYEPSANWQRARLRSQRKH